MAGLYDGLQEVSGTIGAAPGAPAAPKSMYDGLEMAPTVQQGAVQTTPREASGALESLQAGLQGSAPGLAWRGKLPDLVINPEHASWWERALSGIAHVGAELPLMIGGAIAGAPAGAAIGTAVAPGAGTAVGSLLGAGAGMGAVPAAIRQSLIEAYKSGEVMTAADFWNSLREVAKTTAMEAGINAAAMGAGAMAGRVVGKAIAPSIGQTISVPTAMRSIEAADLATQIAAMPTIPAAFQGRMPDAQEFLDAAILIGGLKAAHVTAKNITNVFLRTGKTPAEQVQDAQKNPEVAKDLAAEPVRAEPEADYIPPSRMEMLRIQENLFAETARLNELEAKAQAAPLTDAERLDFNAMKARVLDLERQIQTSAPELARTPTYTADQFLEARKLAEARSLELTTKAETGQLTDAERAERVFLNNSMEKPDALAKHFDLEPQIVVRPTPEQMDASAKKIHDDVLRQVREADEARRASGLEPLGDDHAQAVAALVRARMRTRAERLGMLPEDLYNERPTKIIDETAPEVAAAEAAIPEDAPRFTPPETDLFGNPVVSTNAPRFAVENLATVEVPLANLILSKEVPQFKKDANQAGVIVPLGGTFDRTGVGPIQVWERLNGQLEVISGRHRLDLARRSGEETIPAQIHREADGFDARQAAVLDAELNIREEQGSVADYVQYFKTSGKTREAADELGLLARAKGKAGFAVARDGSDDLISAHRAGQLSDEAALSISSTAPGSARLQALGIAMVNDGKSALIAVNTMRAVDLMAAERMMAGTQGDIFGFDDSALREASAMAKKASSKQRQISEQVAAVSGASKRPELARKMGVNVEDPAAVQAKILELKQEQYLWDNWPLYPELVAKLRSETLKQGPIKDIWNRYDDTGELTDIDLVNEIDAMVENVDVPNAARLEEAVRIWREEKAFDTEVAGRGDMDAANAKFENAVKAYLRDQTAQRNASANDFPMKAETPAEATARDQEAAAEAMRKVNGETPAKLFQDRRDTWYKSALGEAIQNANIKSAAAQGWLDMLKGQVSKGGVKADEIKWSGVEDWLKLQEGKVTKEQVADYLASNGVKVEEVMLGADRGGVTEAEHQAAFNAASELGVEDRRLWRIIDESIQPQRGVDRANLPWWGREMAGMSGPDIAAEAETKARAIGLNDQQIQMLKEWGDVSNRRSEADAHANELGTQLKTDDTKFGTYQLPGGENYRELKLILPGGEFVSSHFPEDKGLLAHIRFNERTDAEGKKVLFVEEIQSDWAQKGKKEGFEAKQEKEWIVRNKGGGAVFRRFAEGDERAARQLAGEHPDLLELVEGERTIPGKVPSAPFVGKTDAWVSLAMKRMIRYAAENGFDKVAWTRGEQQVERYSSALRRAVDVIEWKKTPEGVQLVGYKGILPKHLVEEVASAERNLFAVNDQIQRIVDEYPQITRGVVGVPAETVNAYSNLVNQRQGLERSIKNPREPNKVVDTTEKEDNLSDAIGKAMADQIRNDPNQTGTIEGDQITVSDTGMAGFYDKIVPKVAKEVLKKLGGGKVEEIAIPGTGKKDFNVVDADGQIMDTGFQTLDGARAYIDREDRAGWTVVQADAATMSRQTGFNITPAMREGAMKGQPLFQKRDQQHRGSYDIAENLVTIMAGADKSTVVHELGHSWLEEMKLDAARPDAPNQIRGDWDILRRELAISEDGEISRASHEQFARSVERYLAEGEAPSIELRGVFERFKTWLLDIYKDLRNLNVEINPELREVLDRMLATDEQIAQARDLGVPKEYAPIAAEVQATKIVPPPAPARRTINPGFAAEQASMRPFADELPPGPGEAPDNIHVNYAYINSPMDVKLAMQRMAEIDQANIQRQRGGTDGVKSWAEANAEQAKYLNDILGGSEDTLHLFEPRDPDAPHVDVRLGILKKLAVGAAKDSARLRDVVLEAGHDATVRQQLEYMGSIERSRMIQAEFLGERASVARALNALKDVTEGTGEIGRMLEAIGLGDNTMFQAARTPAEEQAFLRAKLDEIMQNYKGKSVLDIAKLHKEIGTLKGSFKFTEDVTKATKWEMIVEGWRAGLLSGLVTHTTNLFGTAAFHTMRPAVDALSAIIGMARGASPGMGESDRASMSEAVARLTGMLGAVQDGVKIGVATFKLDDPTGKTEAYRTAIPGRAGELIRIPLRLMGAEDALISTMYSRGEIRTLAIRQAFDEQLNPSTREFADRVQALIDNPTEAMLVAAETASTRMTFNMPLGEKGVALQGFVNKWNLQWMIPFIRTPINIAKELLRMSPFSPLIGEWRADFAKGGVARDKALAEIALGSGIMALTAAYAFAGNISGNGSPDPGKNRGKAGVWQPYSILIGDTWYEYSRIQPTGTLMGMAADMAAVWDHMTDEEKDKVPKMLSAAFAQAITNQTFLQGISNFVNAMSDPARFGPRFLQQFAGSMVPNVIGQPTTMADPVVREVNSALEAIQARIPGMRQDLLPKRDWLGEPVPTKERVGVVMPSRVQKITDDKVRLEAARLDISMAAPPKKTHLGKGTGKIGDVKFTPEEQDKFEQIAGQFVHPILANIVNAPGYDAMKDVIKQRIFREVITAGRRVAAVQALPQDKRIAYLQSITEKITAELQPGDTP